LGVAGGRTPRVFSHRSFSSLTIAVVQRLQSPPTVVGAALAGVETVMRNARGEELSEAALRARLANVYWVGGGSGAGKSTVARQIAARHALEYYSTDDAMPDHARRSTSENSPFLAQFAAMDMDERPFVAGAIVVYAEPQVVLQLQLHGRLRCENELQGAEIEPCLESIEFFEGSG
jgi:hypothetical protein